MNSPCSLETNFFGRKYLLSKRVESISCLREFSTVWPTLSTWGSRRARSTTSAPQPSTASRTSRNWAWITMKSSKLEWFDKNYFESLANLNFLLSPSFPPKKIIVMSLRTGDWECSVIELMHSPPNTGWGGGGKICHEHPIGTMTFLRINWTFLMSKLFSQQPVYRCWDKVFKVLGT